MTSSKIDKIVDNFGGEGPPIILVHGFGADRYSWLSNAPDLVKQGKVFTIELPGHGNAWDLPAAEGLQPLCEQNLSPAINQIASESGAPIHLVGHSLGGAMAILAAAHIVSQSMTRQNNTTQGNTTQIASLSLIAPLGLGSGANADFIGKYVELDDETSILELLQRTVFNERLISSQLINPLLMHLRKDGVRATLKTLATDILNPGNELQSAVEQVAASELPRQVIWGLNDNINALVADDQSSFGGHWHTMENCGHLPHVEQRVQANRLIIDMVQSTSDV